MTIQDVKQIKLADYLLKRIEEQTAYIRPASFSFGRQHSDNQPYQGLRVGELSSPALIAYLQEREKTAFRQSALSGIKGW